MRALVLLQAALPALVQTLASLDRMPQLHDFVTLLGPFLESWSVYMVSLGLVHVGGAFLAMVTLFQDHVYQPHGVGGAVLGATMQAVLIGALLHVWMLLSCGYSPNLARFAAAFGATILLIYPVHCNVLFCAPSTEGTGLSLGAAITSVPAMLLSTQQAVAFVAFRSFLANFGVLVFTRPDRWRLGHMVLTCAVLRTLSLLCACTLAYTWWTMLAGALNVSLASLLPAALLGATATVIDAIGGPHMWVKD